MPFNPYLTFSDSAKYAEAAKNLIDSGVLEVNHSFFSTFWIDQYSGQGFSATFSPLVSWFFSLIFRFFPANDLTIITSGYIIFLLSGLLVFIISRMLHSLKAAIISTALFFGNLFFWDYAHNATTEIFFIFELLLFSYIFLNQKIKTVFKVVFSIIILLFMYFTRQQAPLIALSVIASVVLTSWSKINNKGRLVLILFCFIGLLATVFFARFYLGGALQMSTTENPGVYLRGGAYQLAQKETIYSKIFYNIYNFCKSPEKVVSFPILILFILSIFSPLHRLLKTFSLISLSLFIFAASATLPNARYIHPMIPLVIITSSMFLVDIYERMKIRKEAIILVVFLLILPTIGYFTLDARFRSRQLNMSKPPVYKLIADNMAESIPKGKLVITNLDAWAAWYHGLSTMWFSIKPELINGYQSKVDYIVITNYLESDGDFSLGEWKEVVYSPKNITNPFLNSNYHVIRTFTINPSDNYQNQLISGTILKRNETSN